MMHLIFFALCLSSILIQETFGEEKPDKQKCPDGMHCYSSSQCGQHGVCEMDMEIPDIIAGYQQFYFH